MRALPRHLTVALLSLTVTACGTLDRPEGPLRLSDPTSPLTATQAQASVDARVTDFDLPPIWWDKPDEFFFKDYATKLAMLKELMRSNLGNVSFEEVRLQEALNYLDNAIRINETGIDRQVERRAEEIYIQQKALELQARKSGKA